MSINQDEMAFSMAVARVLYDGDEFESAAAAFALDVEELKAAYARDWRVRERAVIEAVKEWRQAEAATLLFIAEAREGGRGLTLKEAEEYYAFKDKEQATLTALRASADELLKGEG